MSITTEYRGHKIMWSDNTDEWTCYDLSDKVRSSPKLSVIKDAIDRLYLAERKAAGTPCWELSQHSNARYPAQIIEYLGAKTESSWTRGKPDTVKHKIAVVATRNGNERPSRREAYITELAPLGPETDAAWQVYAGAVAERKAAEKRERDAYAAIPRIDLEAISKLVELHAKDKKPGQ
jgi:hypothetical protein